MRIPPELHAELKRRASRKGYSLNKYCLAALQNAVDQRSDSLGAARESEDYWIRLAEKLLGDALLGVVLFGSSARGENRDDSDIDLLIVVEQQISLTRNLYCKWDEEGTDPDDVNPHFVHVPAKMEEAGSLWLETAIDGIVLYEKGRSLSRILARIRRAISEGHYQRKEVYGQPYWTRSKPYPAKNTAEAAGAE